MDEIDRTLRRILQRNGQISDVEFGSYFLKPRPAGIGSG
jgi:DNA-binding Lrp family transcriptional regulator